MIHENYQGQDLVLSKKDNIVLSPSYFDDLLLYKGQTLITTDGSTLLGADDKAGIAEIVTAMEHLVEHPEIKHGKIRVAFTPDEEIGRGAHKFDVEKFGADWAYTMDGSQVGELEYENFNAAGATEKFGEDHDPETHLIPIVLQVAQGKREKVTIFGDDSVCLAAAEPQPTGAVEVAHAKAPTISVLAIDFRLIIPSSGDIYDIVEDKV